MECTQDGINLDGTPHYHWRQTNPDARVVYTGPITGTVTLPNGRTYDVTPAFIEVTAGDENAVAHAIGERHATEGHPLFETEPHNFVHTPSEA